MSESKHTPGPWFVGAQNDALYIINRRPAHDNDYPNHDADVTCIAKVYDEANAALIARAPDLTAEVERLRAENAGLRDMKLLRALSKYIGPVLQELQFERGTGSLAAHNLRLCLIEVEKELRGEREAEGSIQAALAATEQKGGA